MVTARKHTRKTYNRLLRLDRPEYFGFRTLQLAKELGLVTITTDGEAAVLREDERPEETRSDEAQREDWKARNLFDGIREAEHIKWTGEAQEGEAGGGTPSGDVREGQGERQ